MIKERSRGKEEKWWCNGWKGGQGHAHDAHGNNMNDKMQHEMAWDENALYDDDIRWLKWIWQEAQMQNG